MPSPSVTQVVPSEILQQPSWLLVLCGPPSLPCKSRLWLIAPQTLVVLGGEMMRLAVCLLAPRPAPQSRWGLSDFALPLPTHSLLANSQASLPHQLLLTPALQEKADQVEKGDEKFLWGGGGEGSSSRHLSSSSRPTSASQWLRVYCSPVAHLAPHRSSRAAGCTCEKDLDQLLEVWKDLRDQA